MDARAQEGRPVRPMPAPVVASAPAPARSEEPAIPEPAASAPEPPVATPSSTAPPPAANSTAGQRVPAQTQLTTQSPPSQPEPPEAPEASVPAPAVPAPASTVAGPTASAPSPDPLPAPGSPWRDGTYTGWGTSRHGDIKAQVVIRNGRIVDASIASCETAYPCDVIEHIIRQPVARQNPEVDHVSRATESADAYYYGLVEALKEAQLAPDGEVAAP